ncbi:MAG: anti-sigma factor [Chloroflexota bacterium]|nr:anti-sigma factor [Chloroflexota bacterium]
MMQMDCETARGQIDAYAIGALDAEEVRALEAHLVTCADCTMLAERAREGGTALALTVPLVSSGPALRARVLASAAVLSDVTSRRRRSFWWQTAAAALVAVIVIGLTWGLVLQRRVDRLGDRNASITVDATAQSDQLATVRTQLVQMTDFNSKLADTVASQDAVVEIVSHPDVRRIQMNGSAAAPAASGRYLWSATEEIGVLVASNLPPLGQGKTYQWWVVYADRWVAGGNFSVDGSGHGQLIVRKSDGVADADAPLWFCVTAEPLAGRDRPTGAIVLRSPMLQ